MRATVASLPGVRRDARHSTEWVNLGEIKTSKRPGLTSEERAELIKLRRANRTLRMERTCGKAAASFSWRTRPGGDSSRRSL
jgi:hypothetical protein